MGEGHHEHEIRPRVIKTSFDSKEEAAKFVKEFWGAMPNNDGTSFFSGGETPDWTKHEFTRGTDRTVLMQGRRGEEKGKWIVVVQGNHNVLSEEAVEWLKGKGVL